MHTNKITRRAALAGTAAAAVATVPAIAAGAIEENPPIGGISADPETIAARIRTATRDLSAMLNEYDDGQWCATVHPSRRTAAAVWLGQDLTGGDHDPDAKLFALAAKYDRAVQAFNRLCMEVDAMEARLEAALPPRPGGHHDRLTGELDEAMRNMTLPEFGNKDHPVNVAFRAAHHEHQSRLAAYNAERIRLQKEMGYWKLNARYDRAADRIAAAFKELINTPAHSIAGLQVKMRIFDERTAECEPDRDEVGPLMADFRRIINVEWRRWA